MEVMCGIRPSYYFSWPDHEILEEHVLQLSCDEDTWLYKIEASLNKQFQHQFDSPLQSLPTSTSSGTVDSRTFTRRKQCALRPSLDTVVESPLSNCSSLGLLSASRLLNATLLQSFCTPPPTAVNQETCFSNSTGSDKKSSQPRIFQLDPSYLNTPVTQRESQHRGCSYTFERNRLDSQSSDITELISLENCNPFEKNTSMTDSLVNFLEKQDMQQDSSCSPTAFLNECCKSEDVSYPAKEQLETVRTQSPGLLLESMSSETENIPPKDNQINCAEPEKDEVGINEISKLNGTFVIENDKDGTFTINNESDDLERVKITNSINILRQSQPRNKGDLNSTFTKAYSKEGVNNTFTKSSDRLNGGMEDDQTSSASDSSFSSTEKPRSISELRSIARQQESSLVRQTSTPSSEHNSSPARRSQMDIELSPITRQPRMSLERSRPCESRSANCSPVRVPQLKLQYPYPSYRLQQPSVEVRRQNLQACSMSNITRTLSSGLRMPQPVKRFNPQQGPGVRPSSVPTSTSTSIPRPQASRLPTLRLRPSGIPGPKRGGIQRDGFR